MKKSLYFLLTLPLFAQSAMLPQEAVDDINHLEGIEDVNLTKGTLTITTEADELSLRQGRFYAMAACEASTISEAWRTVRFHQIRIENASRNQGVKWRITREECEKGMNMPNKRFEQLYMQRDRFGKF